MKTIQNNDFTYTLIRPRIAPNRPADDTTQPVLIPVLMNNAHGQRIAQTLDDRGRTHTETN